MDDGQVNDKNDEKPFYGDHRFLALIIMSIFIAIILIVISMAVYYTSGAAQLDLSRPGYKEVRSKAVTNDKSFTNYSSTGVVNLISIGEFKTLYKQQADKAKAVDAFGNDPLNPTTLWANIYTAD